MPLMAYVNGMLSPVHSARIPVLDRSVLFGDALFEVMKVWDERLIHSREHVQRLIEAATRLRFEGLPPEDELIGIAELVKSSSGLERGYVYLQLSRGIGKARGGEVEGGVSVIAFAEKDLGPSEEMVKNGVGVVTVQDDRALFGEYKTTSAMPRIISKFSALDADAYEALYKHRDGRVFEATAANLFIVSGGQMITPPVGPHVLPGVVREKTIELAQAEGLKVIQRHVYYDELLAADEVFLTGSVKTILGVVRVDQHPMKDGKVGPITRRLRELYWKRYIL